MILPALRIEQGDNRVYAFGVNGKLIPDFAAVSRISRPDGSGVSGYQRPEIRTHINEIAKYLQSDGAFVPNAVVIAFDSRVKFEETSDDWGWLIIPECEDKPGWIVDGQQRVAAVRESGTDFTLCCNAFITDDQSKQREQFILVNSTKPLPKGLIYELLPGTDSHLPTNLLRKKLPSAILSRLNNDEDSPLFGLIQTQTCTGVIKDNSVLKMLENSLSDGVLYRHRDDENMAVEIVKRFWNAVRNVWPNAFGKPARHSRLMHGAGIVALGFVMDAICDRLRKTGIPCIEDFAGELSCLVPHCAWDNGTWEFGVGATCKWNEIQNTSKDVQTLAIYLCSIYKAGGNV